MVRRRAGNSRGFTVVEILFAIALTVIAMAIVTPPTARAFNRTSLRAAVSEVVAAHDYAHTLALQYGRVTKLNIATEWQSTKFNDMIGSLEVRADTTAAGSGETTVRRVKLVKGRMISNRQLLCFDGRGLPSTQGSCEEPDGTIIVQLAGRADTVRFSPMGQVLP